MEFNEEAFRSEMDGHGQRHEGPKVWRVEDNDDLTEDDLTLNLFSGGKVPVREGEPSGGQNFGKGNNTPSANDKNNPSRYAGTTNAFLARTEPSGEHPENNNFKDENQEGRPDYDKARPNNNMNSLEPKPEKVERGNGENDRPHKGETFQEGTADNNVTNIAGPNEVPDQQKVGENVGDDEREHIET